MTQISKTKIVAIFQILLFLTTPLMSMTQDCKKVEIRDFPAKDLPSESDRAKLKNKESYKYYYGIGTEINYVKARQKAFMEIEKNSGESPIDGYCVLMMLYANGFGVERNLDLSIRIACANVWSSPAEFKGRIQHLTDMKTELSKGTFDICDDITSGLMDGICHGIRSEITDIQRKERIDSVILKWTTQEKQSYQELRNAADSFFELSNMYEVDMTGTSRNAMMLDHSDDLDEEFLDKIEKADNCSLNKYLRKDFNETDKKLNSVYSKIKDDTLAIYGSVTKAGVRKTQRKWLLYRDAWAHFGTIKCPTSTEFWWKTMITKERIIQLQDLVESQY